MKKKPTIVRFKPKPEYFDEFVQEKALSKAPDRDAVLESLIMMKDDFIG